MKNGHAPPTHRIEKEQSICHYTLCLDLVNFMCCSLGPTELNRHLHTVTPTSCAQVTSPTSCAQVAWPLFRFLFPQDKNQPITRKHQIATVQLTPIPFLVVPVTQQKKSHIPPITVQRSTTKQSTMSENCFQHNRHSMPMLLRGIDARFHVAVATRSQEPTNPPPAWRPMDALLLQLCSEDHLIWHVFQMTEICTTHGFGTWTAAKIISGHSRTFELFHWP